MEIRSGEGSHSGALKVGFFQSFPREPHFLKCREMIAFKPRLLTWGAYLIRGEAQTSSSSEDSSHLGSTFYLYRKKKKSSFEKGVTGHPVDGNEISSLIRGATFTFSRKKEERGKRL